MKHYAIKVLTQQGVKTLIHSEEESLFNGLRIRDVALIRMLKLRHKAQTLSRLLVVAKFVTDNFQLKNKYNAKRKYD